MRYTGGLSLGFGGFLSCVMFVVGGLLGALLFFFSVLIAWGAGENYFVPRASKNVSELQQAETKIQQGEVDDAIPVLRRLVRQQPTNSETYFLLGEAFAAKGNWDAAAAAFAQGLRINPELDATIRLGEVQIQSGEIREAISTYKGALAGYRRTNLDTINPTARAYNGLGLALHSAFRHSEAEGFYLKALREEPRLAEAYNNLAVLYAETKDYDAAKRAIQRALILEPTLVQAWHNLNLVVLKTSSEEAARRCEPLKQDDTAEVSAGRAEIISGNRRYILEGSGAVKITPNNGARITKYLEVSYTG